MAKKIKTGYDVSGLSIQDIMEMDIDTFNSLNERQLRQVTSRLVSAGNKRIRNLQKKGMNTPAMQSLGTRVGFSVKIPADVKSQQHVNYLRNEFSSVRNFLTAKTSTIRGAMQVYKSVKSNLADHLGISVRKLNKINLTRAFEILHKMQENGQVEESLKKGGSLKSQHARDYIIETMLKGDRAGEDEEDIIDKTLKDYEEFYRTKETTDIKEEEEYNEIDI